MKPNKFTKDLNFFEEMILSLNKKSNTKDFNYFLATGC